MVTGADAVAADLLSRAWQVAESVADPELPMLTLADLGVLREISLDCDHLVVSITPTYSGCPALAEMRRDVVGALAAAGFAGVRVRTVLSPPWSPAMISPDGREKLRAAGIAPPRYQESRGGPVALTLFGPAPAVSCPQCGSGDTRRAAAFSGTACKDLYRCRACGPFEHVKET